MSNVVLEVVNGTIRIHDLYVPSPVHSRRPVE
jgi:hypothetical protein